MAVNTGKIALEKSKIAWFSIRLSLTEVECIKALEVKEITGYSNRKGSSVLCYKYKEIAGHSNIYWLIVTAAKGLAEDKIT